MGPIIRIVLRYGLGIFAGWAASKGIPESVANEFSTSEEVLNAIQLGLCAVGAGCVEAAYSVAKKRGWSL